MARDRAIEAFILKKQDYLEADQIITLFSKQEGKLRCLVKSAKLPTSKLQPMLQPIFQTRITLSGTAGSPGLAKVIGVQLVDAYSAIYEQEAKMGAWYVALELIMRALPDSDPNEPLFLELERYAQFLHKTDLTTEQVKESVTQFQIKVLADLGLGIRTPDSNSESNKFWFSLDRGGFTTEDSSDATAINPKVYQFFQNLFNSSYLDASKTRADAEADSSNQLHGLVNRFVTYQLEREIKSQRNLAST